MTEVRENAEVERLCAQCGTRADVGLIFCPNCKATLRAAAPLVQSSDDDYYVNPNILSPTRRFFVTVLKVIVGIAAVVAIFCPFGSWTQILTFVGSAVIALLCYSVLTHLDSSNIDEYTKDGYWPANPMDRGPTPVRKGSSEKGWNEKDQHGRGN